MPNLQSRRNRPHQKTSPSPPAFSPPSASLLKKVRDAIPKHCWEKSLVTSLGYVLHDLLLVSLLAYAASHIDSTLVPATHPLVAYIAWPAYWFAQGAVGFGIWILGHECGHGAFSDYPWVNNLFGFILHSAVGVPFFSWKISHAKHHKSTSHMTKDTVFVPPTRTEMGLPPKPSATGNNDDDDDHHSLLEDSPIRHAVGLLLMFIFGFPSYLLINKSGQPYPVWTSHFRPDSPIYDKSQYYQVVQSALGIIAVISIAAGFSYVHGFLTVCKYYVVPYMWVNAWLAIVTFLQHTDPRVPHYREKEFNFTRGALATVDRDFGILNHFFHHITDTHIVHHMFSQIPFYHAQEATEVAKEILGEHYLYDDSGIIPALWASVRTCKFVEDEGDIVFYKN